MNENIALSRVKFYSFISFFPNIFFSFLSFFYLILFCVLLLICLNTIINEDFSSIVFWGKVKVYKSTETGWWWFLSVFGVLQDCGVPGPQWWTAPLPHSDSQRSPPPALSQDQPSTSFRSLKCGSPSSDGHQNTSTLSGQTTFCNLMWFRDVKCSLIYYFLKISLNPDKLNQNNIILYLKS